jgi:hypothetical protein
MVAAPIEPEIPAPPVISQRAPLLGWIAKYVLLPLTPFLVGFAIRLVGTGELTWRCFDPAELSFSLAMLCLFGVASARRLDDSESREIAFALFVVGVSIFVSMFSFSIVELTRLDSSQHVALTHAIDLLATRAPTGTAELATLRSSLDGGESVGILRRILVSVAALGLLFVIAGLVLRDRYGLGEE